jgi:DNA-binding ferritin-like protein
MTEAVQIALIIAVPTALTGIAAVMVGLVNSYITIRTDRRHARAEQEAADKVEHVKTALKESDVAVTAKLNTIHGLVNSAMKVQLKLVAELSRWKANETKNAGDMAAADLAEKMLREHDDAQVVLDSRA